MINNAFIMEWLREQLDGKDAMESDILQLQVQCQPNYKKFCERHDPNPFVGHLYGESDEKTIVEFLRQTLNLGRPEEYSSSEAYYQQVVERTESLGILFHKPQPGEHILTIKAEDFRGFVVAEKFMPIICVHPLVEPEVRLFRLVHQLCKICLGLSGLYGSDDAAPDSATRLCHAVAGEFLVPQEEFSARWQQNIADWQDNLWPLEQHFKADQRLLARKALSLRYISDSDYSDYIVKHHHGWLESEKYHRAGVH